jgi:hypothetical protein
MSEEANTTSVQQKRQIPDREFVIAWQSAENADQVSEALGLKRSSVVQRACNLRKKGVRLKVFPKPAFGRMPRDDAYYADLNDLAGEHGELSEEVTAEEPSEEEETTDSDDENSDL